MTTKKKQRPPIAPLLEATAQVDGSPPVDTKVSSVATYDTDRKILRAIAGLQDRSTSAVMHDVVQTYLKTLAPAVQQVVGKIHGA